MTKNEDKSDDPTSTIRLWKYHRSGVDTSTDQIFQMTEDKVRVRTRVKVPIPEIWDFFFGLSDWDRIFRFGLGSNFQNSGIGAGIEFSNFLDWDLDRIFKILG